MIFLRGQYFCHVRANRSSHLFFLKNAVFVESYRNHEQDRMTSRYSVLGLCVTSSVTTTEEKLAQIVTTGKFLTDY